MSLPDTIAAELAGANYAASPALRARVREIASREPEPRRLRLPSFSLRRAALVLAPAVVIAGLGAALAGGLVSSTRSSQQAERELGRVHGDVARGAKPVFGAATVKTPTDTVTVLSQAVGSAGAAVTPAPAFGRAQQYDAMLRLRVKNISRVTQTALRLTRAYGGYVRTVDYGAGTRSGTAELVVRIPLGAVQKAIVRFSALGAIIEQHVSIQDVQASLDRRFRQLQALRAQIAVVQRAGDEVKVARLRKQLVALQREQAQAERRYSYATLSLTLTTAKPVLAHAKPSRLDRALDGAGSVLLRELIVLVYALAVAGPLALLAALALVSGKVWRRRAAERLLARRTA